MPTVDEFGGIRILRFEAEDTDGLVFDKETFGSLYASNSRIRSCSFRRVRAKDLALVSHDVQTLFEDCDFTGAALSNASGDARFVRCAFVDVRMASWSGGGLEFVDCTFSGKFKNVMFWRQVPQGAVVDRQFNEFRGNDFSKATLDGLNFVGGIDLTEQILPEQADLVLVHDAEAALLLALDALGRSSDDEERALAKRMQFSMEYHVERKQHQVLFRLGDISPTDSPAGELASALIAL